MQVDYAVVPRQRNLQQAAERETLEASFSFDFSEKDWKVAFKFYGGYEIKFFFTYQFPSACGECSRNICLVSK